MLWRKRSRPWTEMSEMFRCPRPEVGHIIGLPMGRALATFVMIVAVWGTASSARGEEAGEGEHAEQPSGDFDALVNEAMERYSARRYEEAIELFQRAYELRQEPELIYNIARSHERLLHREEALQYYQQFLELPGTTGEARTRALNNVTSLRREIAALEAARQAEAAQQRVEQQGAQQAGERPATEPPAEEPVATPERRVGALGIAGYALLGIGAASTVAGVAFWGLAMSSRSDFEAAGNDASRLDFEEDLSLRALVGDVLTFSGIGVLGVGVIMVVVDAVRRRERRAPRGVEQRSALLVHPFSMAGGGGVGVSGLF